MTTINEKAFVTEKDMIEYIKTRDYLVYPQTITDIGIHTDNVKADSIIGTCCFPTYKIGRRYSHFIILLPTWGPNETRWARRRTLTYADACIYSDLETHPGYPMVRTAKGLQRAHIPTNND